MARKQRTIDIRKLARKDRDGMRALDLQEKVATLFAEAGFKPVLRGKGVGKLTAHARDSRREWKVNIETYLHCRMDRTLRSINRKRAIKINEQVNELWIVGQTLDEELKEIRHEFGAGVRVMTFEELERTLDLDDPFGKSPRMPDKGKAGPRTRIARTITVNANQLRTAVTTSILLIEEKLNAVQQERPNSDHAKAQRDETIDELNKIKRQLQEIGQLPEQLKQGEVKENEAAKKIKSFMDGVKATWNKKHQVICTKAYDLALFSSYVLVGSLAGAPGAWNVAVSAAIVGGKPVMDSLKGLGKKLFS